MAQTSSSEKTIIIPDSGRPSNDNTTVCICPTCGGKIIRLQCLMSIVHLLVQRRLSSKKMHAHEIMEFAC